MICKKITFSLKKDGKVYVIYKYIFKRYSIIMSIIQDSFSTLYNKTLKQIKSFIVYSYALCLCDNICFF